MRILLISWIRFATDTSFYFRFYKSQSRILGSMYISSGDSSTMFNKNYLKSGCYT